MAPAPRRRRGAEETAPPKPDSLIKDPKTPGNNKSQEGGGTSNLPIHSKKAETNKPPLNQSTDSKKAEKEKPAPTSEEQEADEWSKQLFQ